MKVIDTQNISRIKPVIYDNKAVIENYEAIVSFIRANLEKPYYNLLAKPVVKDDIVSWVAPFGHKFKPFDTFSKAVQKEILIKYNLDVNRINEISDEFMLSGHIESKNWGRILKLVFNYDNNIIYSDGSNYILAWGWQFNNRDENYIPPELLPAPPIVEIPEEVNQADLDPAEEDKTSVDSEDDNKEEPDTNPADDSSVKKTFLIGSQKHLYRKFGLLSVFLTGLGILLKRFWGLLLFFLLLVVLFCFLFKQCCKEYTISDNENERSREEQELIRILPPEERVRIPIDTSNLIIDDSSFQQIVPNRINIALKDKKKSIKKFALDLKKQYPDSSYKIIYLDSETGRLQFEFPDSLRTVIKNDIKKKMTGYDLLIWDESIFSYSKTYNDPAFSNSSQSWYFAAVQAGEAWNITTGNKDVIVAVVDDGFDLNHPELRKANVIHPYNLENKDSIVYANSQLEHGTHVSATIIGKNNNNFGSSGIAPSCSFMPIQLNMSDGVITNTDVIDGILFAIKHGADVVNLSLGRVFSPLMQSLPVSEQEELIKTTGLDEAEFWNELFGYAEKEKVTIVFAGGNDNVLIGIDPMTRSNKVVNVSAIDISIHKASFSNYGDYSTVSAPGVHIYNAIPGSKMEYMDGTSMAAPIVTGAIALMKSKNPDLTTAQILKILETTSKVINSDNIGPLIQIKDALMKISIK